MITIRKKLGILLIICSIIGIFLTSIFVNLTISKKFDKYISHIQDKRDLKIVEYFKEVYKKDGKWSVNSGMEVMHEAYMGNYCITLYDINKNVIWGMDPNDSKFKEHLEKMSIQNKGVYTTKNFEIKNNGKIVGYVSVGQYSSVLFSEEDLEFKNSINKSIIVSSLFTIFIIFIISLYFSRKLSKPIKEVANTSVSLSKGDFKARSNTKSDILELENLRTSINELGEKLKNQDDLRRRLLSDVSHEIRTPLNVLQNNLEAMIDGIFPITSESLKNINDEVIRFGNLLENLNALKEFENESISLNFEKVDLKQIIVSVCKDFYIMTREKNIDMTYHINNDEIYEVMGDREKLKQVFINLISNAIKFNKNEGNIRVTLYKCNKNIIVEIEDEGIGIDKEDKAYIFERLYRADKSRNMIAGAGIGLTIVKEILQLHSASIEVNTEKEKGTKFTVIFSDNLSDV